MSTKEYAERMRLQSKMQDSDFVHEFAFCASTLARRFASRVERQIDIHSFTITYKATGNEIVSDATLHLDDGNPQPPQVARVPA